MLLYKFRSFANFEYLVDILVFERLYCATVHELNDPDEGFYIERFPGTSKGIQGVNRYELDLKTNLIPKNVVQFDPSYRICSFSKNANDLRMWAYYAGSHDGVAIEIDFTGLDTALHEIRYYNTINPPVVNHSDYRTQGILSNPKEILEQKPDHWMHEDEFRIITKDSFLNIQGRIKRILIGYKVSNKRFELLKKIRPDIEIVKSYYRDHQILF